MITRSPIARSFLVVGLAAFGCGDGANDNTTDAGTDSGLTVASSTSGSSATDSSTTTTDGTSASTTGTASATGTSSTSTSTSGTDSATSGGPKFDLGVIPDGGAEGCGNGMGMGNEPEFSYIWIANSSQNTVSKIDTETLTELGRYLVRPDNAGSPSRTSVSLSGDVAVASRNGGITKIYARPEDCQESNGMAGIQTATNATYLPWGTEECVAWHQPFSHTTQRPVAWAPGTLNQQTCKYENEMVWTAGSENSIADSLVVYRLLGSDGSIESTVPMPDVPVGYFGAYGGAVNQAGDFWFVIYDKSPAAYLVRVDAGNLTYDKIATPSTICPYGFTVDSKGRPWIGSFCDKSARYDPMTNTWDMIDALGYGIQEDGEGRMWMADYLLPGVREIDSDNLTLGAQIQLAGSGTPKGISIDFKGNVWVVDMSKSAFRVDPDTQQYQVFDQLMGPYTYSDMTGWGLTNVAFPPG